MRKFFSKNPSSKKLDFLVIGTQKAGTTALDRYFRVHPEIGMADKKELHFFDDDDIFDAYHAGYYKKLHKQFPHFSSNKMYGEITPIYMYWNNALERIQTYNPKIKLIAILRNPMDRAFSQWTMEYNRNQENLPFSEAIKSETSRLYQEKNGQHRVYSYIDRGRYAQQLKSLYSLFPKEQSLIIEYETFRVLQEKSLSDIYLFLKVSDISTRQIPQQIFQTKYDEKLTEQDFHFIYDQLKEDIVELENLLKWDLSHWKKYK